MGMQKSIKCLERGDLDLKFSNLEGFNGWFIDSIDTKTRFLVSSEYVKSRGQKSPINATEEVEVNFIKSKIVLIL